MAKTKLQNMIIPENFTAYTAEKAIHAQGTDLEWIEEFIRNGDGLIEKIKTIYPDESYQLVTYIRDANFRVIDVIAEDVEIKEGETNE